MTYKAGKQTFLGQYLHLTQYAMKHKKFWINTDLHLTQYTMKQKVLDHIS